MAEGVKNLGANQRLLMELSQQIARALDIKPFGEKAQVIYHELIMCRSVIVGRGRGLGFKALDPARRREIAAMGGHAAHAKGVAHRFTSAEAEAAGRKGGRGRKAAAEGPRVVEPVKDPTLACARGITPFDNYDY